MSSNAYSPKAKAGISFLSAAGAGLAVPTTVLAPGSNINGAIISNFCIETGLASSEIALYIGTSAPTGPGDMTKQRIAHMSTAYIPYNAVAMPLFVPPGYGIYIIGGANAFFSICYDVL